jgi:hypothetical protein
MTRSLIQIAAAVAFVVFLWKCFRMAMGLRAVALAREEARRAEEARGRHVVAEIPDHRGAVFLFLETPEAFEWAGRRVAKAELGGCRLLLNGGVMGAATRPGAALPDPGTPEEYEGRERWEVRLYPAQGPPADVPCGTVREGVSRDAARAVFESVRRSLQAS